MVGPGFMGGPMAGQPLNGNTLAAAEQGGFADVNGLAGGMPPDAVGPPPPEGGNEGAGPEMDEAALIDAALEAMMRVASGSTLTEQSKLKAQKAMTLWQEIKAEEEKEQEGMAAGKPSPRMLGRLYAGAQGG